MEDPSVVFEEAELLVNDIHSLDELEILKYTPCIVFQVELLEEIVSLFQGIQQ